MMNDHRPIKRVRQACSNCRNKKVRCSGERPICAQCQRSTQDCVYIYDVGIQDSLATSRDYTTTSLSDPANKELLSRLATLEKRLDDLTSHAKINETASVNSLSQGTAHGTGAQCCPNSLFNGSNNNFDRLPPYAVLTSAVNLFFAHCYNQPYLIFHEVRFRQRLRDGTLPQFLLFALLARVLRFSDDPFFEGRKEEAMKPHVKLSWEDIMQRWFDVEEERSIFSVQAMVLLCSFDYTAKHRQQAWMRVGLAARLALDLGLNKEPDPKLHPLEQEERRRVFWTVYLLDKFATCSRGRPPVLRDEDCRLCLPSDELEFRQGAPKPSHKLSSSLGDLDEASLNPFIMTIIMASLLGRCTRSMLDEDKGSDNLPPWDSRSEFAAIGSQLLLFEAHFDQGKSIDVLVKDHYKLGNMVDQQRAGHVVLSRILFHLCHCILYHPFLLRLRFGHFSGKAPPLLLGRLLESCRIHANSLSSAVQAAKAIGCNTDFVIYSYCLGVCGSIHAIYSHSNDPVIASESNTHFTLISNHLRENAKHWRICAATLDGFDRIKAQGELCRLLCSISQVDKEKISDMGFLWCVLDMATLSTMPMKSDGNSEWGPSNEGTSPLESDMNIGASFQSPPPAIGSTESPSLHNFAHLDLDYAAEGPGSNSPDPFSYFNWGS